MQFGGMLAEDDPADDTGGANARASAFCAQLNIMTQRSMHLAASERVDDA